MSGGKILLSKFTVFFKREWLLRVYIVLQCFGVLGIVVLDLISKWDFLPRINWSRLGRRRSFEWDLLDINYWVSDYRFHNYENLYMIFFLLTPIVITKSLDWILAAKN